MYEFNIMTREMEFNFVKLTWMLRRSSVKVRSGVASGELGFALTKVLYSRSDVSNVEHSKKFN